MDPDKKNRSSQYNAYAKYSGLAIQMGLTIGVFSWLGVYLDDQYQMRKPIFTIVLSLFGIFLSLYVVLKGVIKRDDS
jgi:F0F1-type ATP synthase assembly protein I